MKTSFKALIATSLVTVTGAVGVLIASPFFSSARASNSTQVTNPIDVTEYLQEFHRDPSRVMNTPLAKRNLDGSLVTEPTSPLETSGASAEEIFKVRDEVRGEICNGTCRSEIDIPGGSNFAGFQERNQIDLFLDPPYLNRLVEMENQNLRSAVVARTPWADSFWPQRKGMIARRWSDSAAPKGSDFLANFQYFQAVPPWAAGSKSPAEKYDLLVGDGDWTLTNSQWKAGTDNLREKGSVPGWAGLCHGWSPAAIMAPNPKRSVTVTATNGQQIEFYPSDIKALAALAWGEARPPARQVGVRCYPSNPAENPVGRVRDDACVDVNPATFHMAMVNHIGIQKRSFVMDATYDLQVWNYPVYGYSYEYFNPQTMKTSSTVAGAIVKRSNFTIDKFKEYRQMMAKYVVGVAMDVSYVIPTGPSRRPFETTAKEIKTVRYLYDIEIDADGNMIGGEWYSNFHPDFIWTFNTTDRLMSVGEKNIQAEGGLGWNGQFPVNDKAREVARISSVKQQPLAAVVEALLVLSAGEAYTTVPAVQPTPPTSDPGTPVTPEAVPAGL